MVNQSRVILAQWISFLVTLTSILPAVSFAASQKPKTKLVIYTYDSLVGKGTLGEWLSRNLDRGLNVTVEWRPFSTGGEALNQVLLEGDKTRADLVLGIDNAQLSRTGIADRFEPNPATLVKDLDSSLLFDKTNRFVPFDYGYLAIVYDKKRTPQIANHKSFDSFVRDPNIKKSLALQDPRTSTIGSSFLWWTLAVAGQKNFETFWNRLSPQVRTVAPGWSAAYGAFLKKDASFVVSYTTSPAYHLENDPPEEKGNIVALPFEEGHYRQIESVGIVKASKNKEVARKWIAELLSDNTQRLLPKLQWMYPARNHVTLPETFRGLVSVKKSIDAPQMSDEEKRHWIHVWSTLMANSL